MSNNQIKDWTQLDKLAGMESLRDILFFGNPIYADFPPEQCRIEVLKRVPQVTKIDGDMVTPSDRDLANGVAA